MKKHYKGVHINEFGEVFNRNNGNQIKFDNGLIEIAGKKCTQDEIKVIYQSLVDPVKIAINQVERIKPKLPPKETTEPKPIDAKRNEPRKAQKVDNAKRKDECKAQNNEDAKRKPNKARLGEQNAMSLTILINGKRYSSASEAGRELNLSPSTILRRCKAHITGYSIE